MIIIHDAICSGDEYNCLGFPFCIENVKNEEHPCPTADCPGDARYPAPGRWHLETCTYPREKGQPLVLTVEPGTESFSVLDMVEALHAEEIP